MELKTFLISIGRLKADEERQSELDATNESDIRIGQVSEMQTVGEIFDMLKARNITIPANLQINVPGWPGRQPQQISI